MLQALSQDTKTEIRRLLTEGRSPADAADVERFIEGAESAVAVYLKNLAAQRELPTSGVSRQKLAKVTRTAERLQKQIEELHPGVRQHVRQAFALTGADVLPFIKAMNVLLGYASPPSRGRPGDLNDFALCVGLMSAYRSSAGRLPSAAEGGLFTRTFVAICADPWLSGSISNPRDVARNVLAHPGFEWLKDPIA